MSQLCMKTVALAAAGAATAMSAIAAWCVIGIKSWLIRRLHFKSNLTDESGTALTRIPAWAQPWPVDSCDAISDGDLAASLGEQSHVHTQAGAIL